MVTHTGATDKAFIPCKSQNGKKEPASEGEKPQKSEEPEQPQTSKGKEPEKHKEKKHKDKKPKEKKPKKPRIPRGNSRVVWRRTNKLG